MAYPYSLWSSVPRDGFPPSSQPLSTPPPLVLDNAGYPSYPFEDPDKTYSPAEFASKFPAQPPKCTQGERTSVTDCEIANPSSTSPQHSGKYLEVRTSSYPAAPENTDLDAPTKTYNSQQPRKVQDTRPPVLRFSRSVVALADSARSQDVQVDSSDLNHFPSSSSKPSSRTQQPPEVPTRSPNSVQVLQESIDHLTITSGSAPLSHRGTYQSLSDGSSSASALHPSPLSTHQSYNIFGGLTSSFGEASAFGSNHSNMTNTADTSPVRRQAPVSTLDQPETMPKLLPSVNSVNMETGSTNPSPDSTTDVPTNVPNQAAGPGVAAAGPINGTATPGNQATTSINIEARTIKAALKCSHLVGAYENLAADESTKRRSPMYLDQPPPYLSDEEKHIYRTQYDIFINALNGVYGDRQGVTGDKASHARKKMKGLWFESRRRWETAGKPPIDFGISRVVREALLKSTLEKFVTRPGDEYESDDESTDRTLTDPEAEGEEGEDVDMAEG